MRGALLSLLLAGVLPAGGCVFGGAEKRGEAVDGLEAETDLALRRLDGAEASRALPALSELAADAGGADEIGLRVQALMLTARTLDGEASLRPPGKAGDFRRAALRHADEALREASDRRRFEPASAEAALLLYDARILRSRLDPATGEAMEPLLESAVAEALSRNDAARAAAWRIALCGAQLAGGRPDEARRSLAAAKTSFAGLAKAVAENDPARESLSIALTEAEGDVALRGGAADAALGLYTEALDAARATRRRPEIRRLLLKLSRAAGRAGDADRAAWYRRRAEGTAQ